MIAMIGDGMEKNIIIIDGTSAIWKDQLIGYIDKQTNSKIIKKDSNRKRRPTDKKLDLDFHSDPDLYTFGFDYEYVFANKLYGFPRDRILKALNRYDNVFIVIRNQSVIERIKNDFSEYNVFVVFIYSDNDSITSVLGDDGSLKQSILQAEEDYYSKPELYDLVVINSNKRSTDFNRIASYIVTCANTHKKRIKKTPRVAEIIIPILSSFPIGIIVNALTGGIFSNWTVISIVLSLVVLIGLYVILFITIYKES